MEPIFTTETIHDLQVHKEFSKGYIHSSKRSMLYLIISLALVVYIFQFDNPIFLYGFLFVATIFLISTLIRNQKKGDINYRRMLVANGGNPSHMVIHICENGIQTVDRHSESKHFYSYDQFYSLIVTDNLLILTMSYRLCLIMQKNWLRGGTPEELIAYLLAQCPNIKRKKTKTPTLGKWIHRFHAAVLIIGTLIALLNLPGITLLDRISGKLHNDMTYQEMADELALLGITISDQTIDELEKYDTEYFETNGKSYYDDFYSASKVSDILFWEGCGIYDETTWEWTPSTSGVYWFDSEVHNAGAIYTDFLTGLSAMHEELNFTNIREDYSAVDMDSGSGTVSFSFSWNRQQYQMEAEYYYDWFDTDIIYEVGRIIAADDNAKDLYFAYDNGQGFLLYYGDSTQVRQLGKLTGMDFFDTVNMLMGH